MRLLPRGLRSSSGTCANTKAARIAIYTIQINTGGDPDLDAVAELREPGRYHSEGRQVLLVVSANPIVTTFQIIGTSRTKLKVAK